jgi:hypothetical protein
MDTAKLTELATKLRHLAEFEQCPNETGVVVSGKVRDEILQIVAELETVIAKAPPESPRDFIQRRMHELGENVIKDSELLDTDNPHTKGTGTNEPKDETT